MDQVRDQAWKDQGQAEKNVNSLKVEFDDGWRGSKVSFGGREMVNFSFVSDDEDALLCALRGGTIVSCNWRLATLMAFFVNQHLTYQPLWPAGGWNREVRQRVVMRGSLRRMLRRDGQ